MKKLIFVLAISFMFFVSGLTLTGCFGQSTFKITVDNSASPVFVNVLLNEKIDRVLDGNIVDSKKVYTVDKFSNITVELRCEEDGYDLSRISVLVNGKQQNLNYKNYDLKSGKTLYANFLFGRVADNYDIIVSGVKRISTTFTFQKLYNEETDSETDKKLKLTEINFENEEDGSYSNFGTLLSGSTGKSFTHDYDGVETDAALNKYRCFRLRFKDGDIFTIPQNNLSVENSPFVLQSKDGEIKMSVSGVHQIGANGQYVYYVVDMGEKISQKDEWIISVDFSKIEYRKFVVHKPDENLVCEITGLPDEITYSENFNFTVKKVNTAFANYDKLAVYINQRQVLPTEEKEDSLIYNFKARTPQSWCDDIQGEIYDEFKINVVGVTLENTHKLTYSVGREDEEKLKESFNPTFKTINGENELKPYLSKDSDGTIFTNEELTNAIVWNFEYDSYNSAYMFGYDLYDYDISIQVAQEPIKKLLNVKEVLNEQTANFTTKENVSYELGNGYVFNAIFNKSTGKYDNFYIKFVTSKDTDFIFDNFVRFKKYITLTNTVNSNILVPYTKVFYATKNFETDDAEAEPIYKELKNDEKVTLSVVDGQIIYLRFSILASRYGGDFQLINSRAGYVVNMEENVLSNGNKEECFMFIVSNYQCGESKSNAEELVFKYLGMEDWY